MTTLINYISGVVDFISTPFGITQPVTDNSTLASTTAFIRTYILDLINITATPTIIATVNFVSVRTTLLAGSISSAVNLIIRGSTIAIGKVGGSLSIMGNNIPITSTFTSAMVSFRPNGSRIQGGNVTIPTASYTYVFPQTFTSSCIMIVTPTTNSFVGTQGYSAISAGIRGSIGQNVNWVAFGN
jgi:hypothetical protein